MASTAVAKSSQFRERDVDLRGGELAAASGTSSSLDRFSFSDISRDGVYGIARRQAGRLNAASIDEDEFVSLQNERKTLLQQKFDGGLTKAQERRLNLVRWSLDRIQDARDGHALDELESAVEWYERVGHDVQRLISQLEHHVPRGHRR